MLTSLENLKNKIQNGSYDARLLRLYERINPQKKRYLSALEEFEKSFAGNNCFIISVPAKITLAGGAESSIAIMSSAELDMIAVTAKRDDGKIVLRFADKDEPVSIDLSSLDVRKDEKGKTEGLIRAIAAGFAKWELNIGGFEAYVQSDVSPDCSFLPCLEVLCGTVLAYLYNDDAIAPYKIALIARKAQSEIYSAPCGLEDALTCAMGGTLKMDFADIEYPDFKKLPFDPKQNGYVLCTVNTGARHGRRLLNEVQTVKLLCELLENDDFDGFISALRSYGARRRGGAIMLCKKALGKKGALYLQNGTLFAYVPKENFKEFKQKTKSVFGNSAVSSISVRQCGTAFFA